MDWGLVLDLGLAWVLVMGLGLVSALGMATAR